MSSTWGPGPACMAAKSLPRGHRGRSWKIPPPSPADICPATSRIPLPKERRTADKYITIIGAAENNLKNVTVEIPLGVITCVTGVSGSGKSTLVIDTLHKVLSQRLYRSREKAGAVQDITGLELLDKVINIDQSPIGRTPRSNPATYTGVFADIRDIFAQLPESKLRGYKPGRYSFNVKGGRCEACSGDGIIKIEMHFLPDVYVQCEVCKGARYNRETLEVHYKGKSIADVLDMTVSQALQFMENIPRIKNKLQDRRRCRPRLYPSRPGGNHPLRRRSPAGQAGQGALQAGNRPDHLYPRRADHRPAFRTISPSCWKCCRSWWRGAIRSSSSSITSMSSKTADWVIDLGPEGGDRGGEIVAAGTPEQVAKVTRSYTGQFLRKML